jgi:hypothetical protein
LIAEEVAEVNPDLVVRNENGEIYTVRYDAVNAMLLNEFLKEHKRVEEQQASIARLQSTVARRGEYRPRPFGPPASRFRAKQKSCGFFFHSTNGMR